MASSGSPSPSRASLLPHWDGEVYSKYAARSYDMATRLTGWREKLRAHALEGLSPCRMLDVGCGTGYLLSLARERGFEVTGLDPSDGMLAKAKAQHGFAETELIESGADAIPRPDEAFDLVVASGSLVHIPELSACAVEMLRVLRPGGRIRVLDHAWPVRRSLMTPLAYMFSQLSGDVLHDYPGIFGGACELVERETIGRGGFMQRFDFIKREPGIQS